MSNPTNRNTAETVLSFVRVDESTGCHVWAGSRNSAGYGQVKYQGKYWRAHRLVFILKGRHIPEGLVLDHLCRNRACVNPDHLDPVTPGENARRGENGLKTGAQNRSKTHCPQGHEYAPENVKVTNIGGRSCRACEAAGAARRRAAAGLSRFEQNEKRGIPCAGCKARFWQTAEYHGNFCAECRASRPKGYCRSEWKRNRKFDSGTPHDVAKQEALFEVWAHYTANT